VLIADSLNAPRSLIIHIPITRQNRGTEESLRLVTRQTRGPAPGLPAG